MINLGRFLALFGWRPWSSFDEAQMKKEASAATEGFFLFSLLFPFFSLFFFFAPLCFKMKKKRKHFLKRKKIGLTDYGDEKLRPVLSHVLTSLRNDKVLFLFHLLFLFLFPFFSNSWKKGFDNVWAVVSSSPLDRKCIPTKVFSFSEKK